MGDIAEASSGCLPSVIVAQHRPHSVENFGGLFLRLAELTDNLSLA